MAGSVLMAVNSTNALLQQSVPDAWRGRVIGLYSMAFAGTAPIGGLLAGWLADRIGLTLALTVNGVLIFAAGLVTPLAPAQSPRGPARPDAQPQPALRSFSPSPFTGRGNRSATTNLRAHC